MQSRLQKERKKSVVREGQSQRGCEVIPFWLVIIIIIVSAFKARSENKPRDKDGLDRLAQQAPDGFYPGSLRVHSSSASLYSFIFGAFYLFQLERCISCDGTVRDIKGNRLAS